jgi:hypothetical protein
LDAKFKHLIDNTKNDIDDRKLSVLGQLCDQQQNHFSCKPHFRKGTVPVRDLQVKEFCLYWIRPNDAAASEVDNVCGSKAQKSTVMEC